MATLLDPRDLHQTELLQQQREFIAALAAQRDNMNMNPKNIQQLKDGKVQMQHIPYRVLLDLAKVLQHGAEKYGHYNWRAQPILASTYKAAIMRHLIAWSEGEDLDPDSGINHLYHVMACCVVALDANIEGTLEDDRLRTETMEIEVENPSNRY